MTEQQFQVVRAFAFVVAGAIAVGLQWISPHARLRGSWRVNGLVWVMNLAVIGLVCGACACAVARWAAWAGVGVLHVVALPGWLGILVTAVALDLLSYWWHRANHQVPFLWRFHQVHHSDPAFTVSTGVRFHPGELLLSLPIRLTAVALLGASPESVVLFETIFTVANLVEHGDTNLPLRFERAMGNVFVTPALHRRHHTGCGPDRDTNFGTVLAIWDRSFGTRTDSDSTTIVQTGLPGMESPSLPRVLLLPLAQREA
jgi:sterol desaturase/sphingolipid hydroxylase (fatty acid hydroxylase superfamily)